MRTQTKTGLEITIRPVDPVDETQIVEFHKRLSDETVFLRYFHAFALNQRINHERLTRICHVDHNTEIIMVVERVQAQPPNPIIAVGRLNQVPGTSHVEFAVLIEDKHQKQGIGTVLLHVLIELAAKHGWKAIVADILPENGGMQNVCRKLGFQLAYDRDQRDIKAFLSLAGN